MFIGQNFHAAMGGNSGEKRYLILSTVAKLPLMFALSDWMQITVLRNYCATLCIIINE